MYYFKVQPPLPFARVDHGGVKVFVCKSTSNISVCSSTTASRAVFEKLVNRELGLMGLLWHGVEYKISRVNEKYFKLAVNKVKAPRNQCSDTKDESITTTFKKLIRQSGLKISDWILKITKYE